MEALLEFIQASPLPIWALFALLILCGLGLPMPEDIVLISAGLIAAESGRSWIYVSLLMYVGVVAGDSLIFAIGRRFGRKLLSLPWTKRWLNSEKQERINGLFERYGSATFFIARFMPGLRAPIFCTAGAMKVRYLQFVLFDGLAALISVPIFVWIGEFLWRKFGDNLEDLSGALDRTHSYTLIFAITVVAIVAVVIWVNRRKLLRALR